MKYSFPENKYCFPLKQFSWQQNTQVSLKKSTARIGRSFGAQASGQSIFCGWMKTFCKMFVLKLGQRTREPSGFPAQPAVVGRGGAVPLASACFQVVLENVTCRGALSVGEAKAASLNWINSTNVWKEGGKPLNPLGQRKDLNLSFLSRANILWTKDGADNNSSLQIVIQFLVKSTQQSEWKSRITVTERLKLWDFGVGFPNRQFWQLSPDPIQLDWKLQTVLLLHRVLLSVSESGDSQLFLLLLLQGGSEVFWGKQGSGVRDSWAAMQGDRSAFAPCHGLSYVTCVFGSRF